MTSTDKEEKREQIHDKLIAEVNKKIPGPEAKLINEFLKSYYDTVALEDLLEHKTADLYGAMISHWHLCKRRKDDEVKIRIYNPDFEQHGWESIHSVIEVVSKDMPFMVDSLLMELNRRDITVHMVIHVGGLLVKRDEQGKLLEISAPGSNKKDFETEAPIFIEIDRQTDADTLADIERGLYSVLEDVTCAVEDWQGILAKVKGVLKEIETTKYEQSDDEIAEAKDFIKWLANDHFTFIGYREYDLIDEDGEKSFKGQLDTGLGVLRESMVKKGIRSFAKMTAEAREHALSPNLLMIAKTNTKSTIHRPVYTDHIGIKRFNEQGEVIGEHRFIGLFTSAAYNRNPKDIPLLRKKVTKVLERSTLSMKGHAGKALINILETYPRDDLFQTSSKELLDISMGILHLQERRRTRLFVRKDIYGRFMSCLVFVPRDTYNTQLRVAIEQILMSVFNGIEISFKTHFSESVLARVHYMVRINPGEQLEYDVQRIEKKIIKVCRSWKDKLKDELLEFNGEAKGNQYYNIYADGFPAAYIDRASPRTAVYDIQHFEKLKEEGTIEVSLFKSLDEQTNNVRFKIFSLNQQMPLSDVIPILENMGLHIIGEEPYKVYKNDGSWVWISDFSMAFDHDAHLELDAVRDIFQEDFASIWFGKTENDGFNKLVLSAMLDWYQITMIRAYTKYFRQIGFTFSQQYIEHTLIKHSSITKKLVRLFELRFDPALQNEADELEQIDQGILNDIDQVTSLDEDRILKNFYLTINATLRCNYYQRNGNKFKEYLSFKFNPEMIPDMPLPKPEFEIFVYSPKLEGVHLRSGKVARGGLRWSDRREDFRTEILGLVKAQIVKNSVIVPAGAKGGFVVKNLLETDSRDEFMAKGIEAYQTFISGLLDLTDNLVAGEIVQPNNTVIYDEPDPYLVVAADKGTATFPDYANDVSQQYGFWLDDAFASGGKTGYDHKAMGITAKGAWESVKRHFRELGHNTQKQDFTVVGIGDMAGDVFGNGLMLSEHVKLVGAFNHMHIFVDPNPNPAISLEERRRMFDLPRSAWSDYNEELISKGGGIYSRSAKAITLSDEARELFDISQTVVEPNDLIQAMLRSRVDLLWNGGIGTFVKSKEQTHAEVGDRANDLIRINGEELRCRVVGEGGNLGFTQLGRIEYALNGGLIYADSIDNSAGVDCSDHEVNIKILVNQIVSDGDMTTKQRNELLAKMTDEVSDLVLNNNYKQTQAISVAAKQTLRKMDTYIRFIIDLENAGSLNRELEYLPDDKQLLERKSKGMGLTRPELSVLIAYSKIQIKEMILDSDVPEDRCLAEIIFTAFPATLKKLYQGAIENHNLRREIIATQISNSIVNDMGITFVQRVQEEIGAPISSIIRAYALSYKIFNAGDIFKKIEDLDYEVTSEAQIELIVMVQRLLKRATRWFLNNIHALDDLPSILLQYESGVSNLITLLPDLMHGMAQSYISKLLDDYQEMGVPLNVAQQVANTAISYSALDILSASVEFSLDQIDVAKVYFALGEYLDLYWLKKQIIDQQVDSHWESLAKVAFRDDVDWQQRELAVAVLRHNPTTHDVEECIDIWSIANKPNVDRWQRVISDLRSSTSLDFVMIAVALRSMLDLTNACKQTAKQMKKQLKCSNQGETA